MELPEFVEVLVVRCLILAGDFSVGEKAARTPQSSRYIISAKKLEGRLPGR
jgi:hypothetical protein